jgi:DNA polymerase I
MEYDILKGKLISPRVENKHHQVNYHYIRDNQDLDHISEYLEKKPAQNFDTETEGLDVIGDEVLLVQIGDENVSFVVDAYHCDVSKLKWWFESKKHKKCGHNLIFDHAMLYSHYKINSEMLRCSFIAETILTIGSQFGGKSLLAVAKKYLNLELDKEMQKSFIGHKKGLPFSDAQLAYAALDVRDPIKILQKQSSEIQRRGLGPTFLLECDSIMPFGDMRVNGMKLDKDLWQQTIESNKKKQIAAKEKMDETVEQYYNRDFFGELSFNYDSTAELLNLLKMMKVKVRDFNKKTNEWEDKLIQNTNKQTQKKIANVPFIKTMSEYRRYSKLLNTYGENFYAAIHPKTGRIHPELKQIGTETGRPSAGSENESDSLFSTKKMGNKKDGQQRMASINPLNIPAKAEYRHAFVAEDRENYCIETDDYSGCETRIWGELSMDPQLLHIFDNGIDSHCFVGSKLYRVEVTKDNENAMYRKPAKQLNFGIAYGMSFYKLFEDLNADGFPTTLDEAKKLFDTYCEEIFPVGVNYLRSKGVLASQQGYLSNLNGRIRHWRLPDPYNKELFPKGKQDRMYKSIISKIQRDGGNFEIQSVNADITKRAMVDLRAFIKEHNVRSKIVNAVYDEIVTETHKDDSVWFWKEKQRIMREAAEVWLKRVPMEVSGVVLPYWTKD